MIFSTLSSNDHLVNIDIHSLTLYTHDSEFSSFKDLVVLFIFNVTSDALNWQVVMQLLSFSLRSYIYDRVDYHNLKFSSLTFSIENVALKLSLLIEKTFILNSLILVRHFWVDVLTHEYIALKKTDQIADLMLVNINHETASLMMNVNDSILWTVVASVESYSVWDMKMKHKLTQKKWDAFRAMKTIKKFKLIERKKKFKNYMSSFKTLRKKKLSKKQSLIEDKSIYVIESTWSRDWSELYKTSIAKENEIEKQRSHVRESIKTIDTKNESLMKKFLKLSMKSKLIFVIESEHFVQMTQSKIVVDEVKWILDNLSASS